MTNRVEGLLSSWSASSLSEYDLSPSSAPNWLIGELLAVMHAGRIRYRELRPGHIVLMDDGCAVIARGGGSEFSQPLDPIAMAADFLVPSQTYDTEDFRAILSGYARAGYEFLDALLPGFTDALLDHVGAPQERPRRGAGSFDWEQVVAGLGVSLRATKAGVQLHSQEPPTARNAWNESPTEVVLAIAACRILELDPACLLQGRAAEAARGQGATLLRLLQSDWNAFDPGERVLSELQHERSTTRMALAIAACARTDPANTFAFALRALEGTAEDDAAPLADVVLALASRCALLAETAGCEAYKSRYYVQRAAIVLQYFTKGQRADEGRSCQLMHTLHRCGFFPPVAEMRISWPRTATDIALAQSLLLACRETFQHALTRCSEAGLGFPWSAAIRGLGLARRTLWRMYDGASAREEGMAEMLQLAPSVIKSYAYLLGDMFKASSEELAARGESGWAVFFAEGNDGPAHMTQELRWICDFLELAAKGPLSLDAARHFMALGGRFAPRARPGGSSSNVASLPQ
jgi:hypothetical protein